MPEITAIRLSELNSQINGVLQNAFGRQHFWVMADITNHSFKAQKNYHNFELVEKDPDSNDIIARISGKAWGKGALRIENFEKITGQPFTNNIHVLVNVSVGFHAVYGLQVNLHDVDTSFTLGILEQQKQATLEKLVRENPSFISKSGERFITRNNQLMLRPVIQQIAVISSANSAGNEDFSHTLINNHYGYHFAIDYYFTEVQGENNAQSFLKKIIEVFNAKKDYDVVVITRGGGAQSDFLIFDNYYIARALAKFPIPVITGIGHQKNETIADLMVHTQTKTPTKAAELIIAHNRAFEENIIALQKGILVKTRQLFAEHFLSLSSYSNNVVNNSRNLIAGYTGQMVFMNQQVISMSNLILFKNKMTLNKISSSLTARPKILLNNLRNELESTGSRLKTGNTQFIKNQQSQISHFISVIKLMSPDNILRKGFAIVKLNNKICSNPDQIAVGNDIDVILADTSISTTVRKKTKYDGKDFNL